jgi:hypothetical protein
VVEYVLELLGGKKYGYADASLWQEIRIGLGAIQRREAGASRPTQTGVPVRQEHISLQQDGVGPGSKLFPSGHTPSMLVKEVVLDNDTVSKA